MTSRVDEIAYAKLNLALHVRRRRADGYHELDTLFAFTNDGDSVSVTPAATWSLTIDGPFAAGLGTGDDNLVLRAAHALAAATGASQAGAIRLDKRLPVAAGIGGGSADAAATLRALARLWDIDDPPLLQDVGARLGADVPACIASVTQVGQGIGDRLTPIAVEGIAGAAVLLVNPRLPCPTGPVFAAWDGTDRGPLDPHEWRTARNDLEAPAVAIVPAIAGVLDALYATGAATVRMSGSGATCFALYTSALDRDIATESIRASRPDWWMMATTLR